MARLKGFPQTGKSITLKSGAVIYVNRGALVASWWPKKRGRPKSQVTRDQNEWFRQANLLAKYADGQAAWMAIEVTRGSPWYPRDLLISAMAGRLFETLNLDGVEFRSVAIRDDVSSDLDFLAGKIPGTIIIRGQNLWGALVPGVAGDVLTSNGPGVEPAYAPGGAGSGLSFASNVPTGPWDTSAFATKGFPFQPTQAFGIHSIGTLIQAVNGHTYRGSLFEISFTWLILDILGETADITSPLTGNLQVQMDLPAPVTVEPNKVYVIAWTRRDGPDNFAFRLNLATTTGPLLGVPINHFNPFGGVNPKVSLAKANPAVNDQMIASTFNGFFISAEVSL